MRYAILTFPLLPLALAAVLAGGHVADTVTDAVREIPAVRLPVLRDYRVTAIRDGGAVMSSQIVTAPIAPRVHIESDGRWSVGVWGVFPVAPPVPRGWIYDVQPIDP